MRYEQSYREPPPEDSGNNTKKLLIIVTGALLVIAILGAGTYFFISNMNSDLREQETENSLDALNQGWQQFSVGGGDPAKSFLRALELANTPTEESFAKFAIGSMRSFSSRPEEGISLLKEISLNTEYPRPVRAQAVNMIFQRWSNDYDLSLAENHIFVGPVWEDFLTSEGTFFDAQRRALEFSSEISSTPYAEYRVALSYSSLALRETDQKERATLINKVKERIAKGDEVVASQRSEGVFTSNSVRTHNAIGLSNKALALETLLSLGEEIDLDGIENAYRKSIEMLETSGVSYEQSAAFFFRLHYAGFLVELADESRLSGIEKILSPLVQAPNSEGVFLFLRSIISLEGENLQVQRAKAVKLAKINPSFRERLVEIGWPKEELQ